MRLGSRSEAWKRERHSFENESPRGAEADPAQVEDIERLRPFIEGISDVIVAHILLKKGDND